METPQQPADSDRPPPPMPWPQTGAPTGQPAPTAVPPFVPPPVAPPPVAPPTVPAGSGWRLALALVAGVVALLCLGGGVIAFTVYDNKTKFDRSKPDIVAMEYVGDLLVHRDRDRARLWACDGAQLQAADGMLDDIVSTEQRLDTSIIVNSESITVRDVSKTQKEVRMEIRRSGTVDGIDQSVTDPLTLTLEDRDGWRVCGATAP